MAQTVSRTTILRSLPVIDQIRLSNASQEAAQMEYTWGKAVREALNAYTNQLIATLEKTGEMPELRGPDLADLLVRHSFHVLERSLQTAESDCEKYINPITKLAKPPARVPRSLIDLQKLWDHYRRKKHIPARQRALAESIRKNYLKKVQDVWRRHSEEFRSGDVFHQEAVVRKIQKAASVTQSRAKMIVETETTKYYNQARKQVYDASPDVTHYLFLAIRDKATTKWCKSRNGLVYIKGQAVTDRELPPIHWNCRSEMLPLVASNPAHLKLIKNLGIQRARHRCEPLPKGWNRIAA